MWYASFNSPIAVDGLAAFLYLINWYFHDRWVVEGGGGFGWLGEEVPRRRNMMFGLKIRSTKAVGGQPLETHGELWFAAAHGATPDKVLDKSWHSSKPYLQLPP